MSLRFVAMRRRHDISPATFRHHWLNVHGPLMAQVPGIRYVQNHVTNVISRTDPGGASRQIDGFAQIDFVSDDAMRDASRHPASGAAGKDLPNFVGASTRLMCDVDMFVAPTISGSAIKRIDLLHTKSDVEADRLRDYLKERASLAMGIPGVLGIRQCIVSDQLPITDSRIADAEIQVSVILETWFASIEAMMAALASNHSQRLAELDDKFVVGTTAYLVEEIQIAP